jgi:hypothetical protein
MPLVIESVCLKTCLTDFIWSCHDFQSACELQGVKYLKDFTEIGRTEFVMHSSHTVVFFPPRMNFCLGKYTEGFTCLGIKHIQRWSQILLTLILLTWTIWRAPTNASKWRMGFNSAFKGLITYVSKKLFVFVGKLCDLHVCGLCFFFFILF